MSKRDRDDDGVGGNGPDADGQAILTRRRFLIQAAMASAGLTLAGAMACEDTEPEPQPCLSPREDTSADGAADTGQPEVCLTTDVQPEVCLSVYDTEDAPQVCLEPPLDIVDTNDPDMPQPCLSPPIDDVSDSDDMPQPCLTPALDTSDGGDA